MLPKEFDYPTICANYCWEPKSFCKWVALSYSQLMKTSSVYQLKRVVLLPLVRVLLRHLVKTHSLL